ncbi:MAG TPA: pitrilysin family protein, partial [Candidatus Eisenbacteria bacterium]|nr:pitrilysin family protein [Candidatus Eisenbacteria bacterium]
GLTVYVVESHRLPLVSANLVFRSGSASDPADLPGLAGYTAAMLDEGTTKRDALALADQTHALGASLVTGSQPDGSSAGVRSLKQNAAAAIDILSDITLHPSFPDQEVERIRNDRLTTLMQQRDQPWPTGIRVMNACLFGPAHPYGHTQIGTQASIEKTKRDDLIKFYGSTYSPKNAALILVGDLTDAEAKKLATDAFGAWKGAATPAPVPATGTMATSRIVIVDKPGSVQTVVLAGQFGVKRSDPDYEKLDLMNTVLGGLFSSRINLNLREDKGYSYGAFSFVGQNRGVGNFIAGASVRADVTGPSVTEVLKEVTKLRDAGVTADELRMAKESTTRSLPANFETTFSTAGTLAGIYLYDLPLDYYQTLPSRLSAITTSDVAAVAKKHLVPERMVVVTVGDRSKIEPQLTKLNLGAVAYRDPDGKEISGTTGSAAPGTGSPGTGSAPSNN